MSRINIQDAVKVGSTIFFIARDFNMLYSYSIEDDYAVVLGQIPWEKRGVDCLYGYILYHDGRLYLTPHRATGMAVYDVESRTFEKIDLGSNMPDYAGPAVIVGDNMYIFYCYEPLIKVLNLKTRQINNLNHWAERKSIYNRSNIYFGGQIVTIDESIYIPHFNADAVMRLNTTTQEISVVTLGNSGNEGYIGICHDGDSFWLLPLMSNRRIVCWKEKDNIVEFHDSPYRIEKPVYMAGIALLNNRIFVYAQNSIKSEDIEINPIVSIETKGVYFVHASNEDVLYCRKDIGGLVNIDVAMGMKIFDIDVDKNSMFESLYKGFVIESPVVKFCDYLDYIMSGD